MTPLQQNTLAFEAIVSTKRAWLHAIAMRQLTNHADAEDVVQDALLLAHKNLPRFRGDSSLSTWLYTIVRNCARMHRRRNSCHAGLLNVDDLDSAPHDPSVSPESACIDQSQRATLLRAIDSLPLIMRQPLLHRMAGRTVEEIAVSLNRPTGTVKPQLSRARHLLRRRLNPKWKQAS